MTRVWLSCQSGHKQQSYCGESDATFASVYKMDKNEFRVLIKHRYLIGKNTLHAQQWLEKCYPDCVPSKTTICRWYADFKRGRTDKNDAERSGRSNKAVTPENIKQVLKIVMDDRKLKVREIAKMVNISTGSVSTILNEKLGMKKVFSKWVPRLLTMEQKQQRVDDSVSCLSLFTRNKQDFLPRYVRSVWKRNSQLAKSWRQFFGMRTV